MSAFDISEFLAMGGYAFYVWPAYILAGVVLGGGIWLSLWEACVARRQLAGSSEPERSADDPALPGDRPAS